MPYEGSSLKFIYGQAFRAPNTYEQYSNDGGASKKSNPSLQPEKIRTYEVIFEQYLKRYYRLFVSGFYYQIKDLISFEIDWDGLGVFKNSGTVNAKGGELEIEAKWRNGIEAKTSYSFTQAMDNDGRILSNSPKHLVTVNSFFPLFRYLTAGIELQYMSNRKLRDRTDTGGYIIANTTLLSKELVKDLDVSASVYNMFNKKFSGPVGQYFNQKSLQQDGRSWRIKMTYRF
jgi:iron complex outermembrane receptor protein